MITKQQKQINLHLPASWNRCDTEELEIIASAIISEQLGVGRYHPFDWSRVKLKVVLGINHLEVVNDDSATDAERADEWMVKRPQDSEPWPISTGQLAALAERLAWMNDEKSNKVIFQFPYPELKLVQGSGFRVKGSGLTFGRACSRSAMLKPVWHCSRSIAAFRVKGSGLRVQGSKPLTVSGPPPLLDGYTWREYRLLTDWMQAYMRCANAMAQSKREDVRRKNAEAAAQAQREFLVILFKPAGKPAGTETAVADSQLSTLNSQLFEGFSPVKWQVILFWWSSLMWQLAKKFPKVFKQQAVGKDKQRRQQQDTPWDFYNRVTATVQKYIGGLSEQDVNNATYGTILQQLEMMADEAAEMEKMKQKK